MRNKDPFTCAKENKERNKLDATKCPLKMSWEELTANQNPLWRWADLNATLIANQTINVRMTSINGGGPQ